MQIKVGKSQGAGPIEAAKNAVQFYEEQMEVLQQMRREFDENFPEAASFLTEIKNQEDYVSDAIAKAKPLVAKAGETVGDFKCQRKYSKAHYDPATVTRIVGSADNGGEVFMSFVEAGIVKKIDLDKEGTVAYFAQNPDLAEAFHEAWKDKTEITPAVTTPKF